MDLNVEAQDKPDIGGIDRSALATRASSSLFDPADFAVVVPRAAWEAMHRHAHERLDVEVGGVLVGRTFLSQHGTPYLFIDAIVPAVAAESRQTNITFTGEAWTRIHDVIDKDYPEGAIVGWYHTHPAFGIFLSEMDVFICRHFFDLPHQVAIVIDPVAKTHGCFVWRGGVPTLLPMVIEGESLPMSRAVTITQAVETHPADTPPTTRESRSSRERSPLTIFPRLEWSQWLALLGLILLAAIVFGALAMMWLNLSPADVIERVRGMMSDLSQGGV